MRYSLYLTALFCALTVEAATFKATSAAGELPGLKNFEGTAEGASVDPEGRLYMVDATKFGAPSTDNVFKFNTTATSHFAASRFTRSHGLLVGDATGHIIHQFMPEGIKKAEEPSRYPLAFGKLPCAKDSFKPLANTKDAKFPILLKDDSLVQPNDMAVSPDERFLFLSGAKFTDDSIAGEHGEVAVFNFREKKVTYKVPKDELVKLGVFRTNGIEVSPDGKFLYVTSAQNKAQKTVSTKIFRWKINKWTGELKDGQQVLDLYPFLKTLGLNDAEKDGMDPDGMRFDKQGRLFITLNAFKRVLRWDPNNKDKADIIELDSVVNPSNLELGGADGKTLFVVGRCAADAKKGCVDKYVNDAPGRAWSSLQKCPK